MSSPLPASPFHHRGIEEHGKKKILIRHIGAYHHETHWPWGGDPCQQWAYGQH